MPTYEYECQKCGHRFEEFQSMKDAPLTKCPQCKGRVKRLIGAGAGILFKGSGFYATDYRSSSYGDRKKKDAGGPASAGGTSAEAGGAAGSSPAAPSPAPARRDGKDGKASKGGKRAND